MKITEVYPSGRVIKFKATENEVVEIGKRNFGPIKWSLKGQSLLVVSRALDFDEVLREIRSKDDIPVSAKYGLWNSRNKYWEEWYYSDEEAATIHEQMLDSGGISDFYVCGVNGNNDEWLNEIEV